MRLYRVHYLRDDHESMGFEWFASRQAANRAAWEHRRTSEGTFEIRELEIDARKAGLLKFLNEYASDPSNG